MYPRRRRGRASHTRLPPSRMPRQASNRARRGRRRINSDASRRRLQPTVAYSGSLHPGASIPPSQELVVSSSHPQAHRLIHDDARRIKIAASTLPHPPSHPAGILGRRFHPAAAVVSVVPASSDAPVCAPYICIPAN
uniref:Uncharacterized protein n=1 Tax=Oryza meridionalis TaxID=40149 RepID=A0A0E0CPK9_9ORYZ